MSKTVTIDNGLHREIQLFSHEGARLGGPAGLLILTDTDTGDRVNAGINQEDALKIANALRDLFGVRAEPEVVTPQWSEGDFVNVTLYGSDFEGIVDDVAPSDDGVFGPWVDVRIISKGTRRGNIYTFRSEELTRA